MQERYTLMKHLGDHLTELFALCGIPAQQVPIEPAPALLRWLENLLQDKGLHSYLTVLDHQAETAIRTMKDRALELWNAQQNELLLQKQEQEIDQLRRQLQEQKKQPDAPASSDAGLLETISGIIAMRDNLLMRKSWICDFAPQEEAAAKLVEGQLRETAKLLERTGVEIMEGTEAFNSQVHTVVETKPAQFPEQVDQIAETFRPGYRFRGEVLRPQEVILYIKT